MKEIWKQIKGYEGLYEISNKGRVRSMARWQTCGKAKYWVKAIIMKQEITRHYYKVDLCKNGKHHTYRVNRLVAQAFIPNPNHYPEVNHKDENKLNNCADNLEWCTHSYNSEYGHHRERVTKAISKRVGQYTLDGKLVKIWPSTHEAGRHGYNQRHVCECCNGIYKKHAGYKWRYI